MATRTIGTIRPSDCRRPHGRMKGNRHIIAKDIATANLLLAWHT